MNQLKGSLNSGDQGIVVSLGGFTSRTPSIARASANLTLIDTRQFVSLFLDHYDKIEPAWQAKFPLKRAYVPSW